MKAWDGVGEAYAASYAALCAGTFEPLTAALGPAEGRGLLDVGAGEGRLTSRFARRGWDVTACEPEPTMRAVAHREHPTLRIVEGGLPTLPFGDGSFDAAVANFVLNHVSSPRTAARELGRVARGPVAATIWTRSPSWFWAEVVERAGLPPYAGERLPAEEDFARTPDGFADVLTDAGLPEVVVTEHTWTWEADPGALWTSVEGGVAGAGAQYALLSTAERRRFRAGFEETVAAHRVGTVLPLEHRAAVAVSRRG
ncbi:MULTISPECIES: class I SAM-dependent methyltransferase [unclassified Microbacterium]|uniref:class I SAM-dependent methyltransferase n=1 Tax=unclassified Microbacterium TaxID=2609290 RepID=UPI001656D16A|nr:MULTISPECIES: class I SAM-dependent methyltransferase [unclassified Microbacterium]CAD5138973.1 SAM-dependent methyltransferase [Microbacterium sp. Nx66]